MDETGYDSFRKLNVNALFISACQFVSLILYITQFKSSCFTNPEYELVAIHSEHFLPCGGVLPIFHSASSTPTLYVSARDRRLHESSSPESPSLPAFHHVAERSTTVERINVFLVVLNAEIKFHRYLSMISQNPPTTPLPADVLNIMHLTVELVHLLYWNPVPTKGSPGKVVFVERMKRRSGCSETSSSDAAMIREREMMMGDEETDELTRSQPNLGHERKFGLPADMDLEARKKYGRALMHSLCHGTLPFLSSSHCS
jgi:hypothetical protein